MKSLQPKSLMVLTLMVALFANVEPVSAQVVKMETTSISYKYKNDNLNWTDWADFEETSVLVSIDPDKNRIMVFSKKTQVFDVLENEGKTRDADGDDFYSFYCKNEEGKKCRIKFAILHSRGGRSQLYINYDDFKVVYNLKNSD